MCDKQRVRGGQRERARARERERKRERGRKEKRGRDKKRERATENVKASKSELCAGRKIRVVCRREERLNGRDGGKTFIYIHTHKYTHTHTQTYRHTHLYPTHTRTHTRTRTRTHKHKHSLARNPSHPRHNTDPNTCHTHRIICGCENNFKTRISRQTLSFISSACTFFLFRTLIATCVFF